MAREEQDREDLLREATALTVRAELELEGEAAPVVVGFRGEAASLYFGADPVYHFNAQYALRRAFVGGALLKAERGRLIQLRRERTPHQVLLLSRELTEAEAAQILAAMEDRIRRLHTALANGQYRLNGAVPAADLAMSKLCQWLADCPPHPPIAETPNVGG